MQAVGRGDEARSVALSTALWGPQMSCFDAPAENQTRESDMTEGRGSSQLAKQAGARMGASVEHPVPGAPASTPGLEGWRCGHSRAITQAMEALFSATKSA